MNTLAPEYDRVASGACADGRPDRSQSVAIRGNYQTPWNELLAGSMLAAIVTILLLLPFQRYYIQAITSSGLND